MNERRKFDILYMQTQILNEYSRSRKIPYEDISMLFEKYGILEYIEECFEILHVRGIDSVLNDISKRISGGIKFAR